ncbi:MAG: hypothetical protein IIA45_15445 [Bacteroidetes bacterium]|nr:hypothetical protein [Bacteroidota bacterium]
MPDEIIDMKDMGVIFAVTDTMGIHRESVRVELTKEDPGSINRASGGIIEITIPETGPTPLSFMRSRALPTPQPMSNTDEVSFNSHELTTGSSSWSWPLAMFSPLSDSAHSLKSLEVVFSWLNFIL